ncbi:hypothetical protein CAPTEDRAFT_209167, partial [Capitella teleta]
IVPLFLIDILGDHAGVPGLIIAAIFAAALSSVSSAVNSLAALTLEDFIKPIHLKLYKCKLSEKLATRLTIGFAFIFGTITIGISFAAEYMGDKLLEMALSVWSIFGGPVAGVFIMGFFFPWVNSAGALSGMLISLTLSLWLCIGGLMYKAPTPILPLRMGNMTHTVPTRDPSYHPGGVFQNFYDISFALYAVFSTGTCLLIGNLVSVLTNNTCKAPTDGKLFYNCVDKCYCYCPENIKNCLRCGINFEDGNDSTTGKIFAYDAKPSMGQINFAPWLIPGPNLASQIWLEWGPYMAHLWQSN